MFGLLTQCLKSNLILEKGKRAKSKKTLRSSSKKKHKLKIAKKKVYAPK